MKKVFLVVAVAALAFTSCTTTMKTASSIEVANQLNSFTKADLEVSDTRITYTFRPEKKERRGGTQNVYNHAVAAALRANGGGDLLVAPQFETRIRTGLFGGRKIKEVTVSGYPAKYKNFRTVEGCRQKH